MWLRLISGIHRTGMLNKVKQRASQPGNPKSAGSWKGAVPRMLMIAASYTTSDSRILCKLSAS